MVNIRKMRLFEIDNNFSNKSNLFSVRKMEGNRDLFWKINQTTKKLVLVNKNEMNGDKSLLLFEIVHP